MERLTELELCAQHSEIVINNKLPSIQTTTDFSLIRNDTNLTQPFVLLSSNAKTVDRSKSMGALLPDIAGQYENEDITDTPVNITVSISVPLHLNVNSKNYPATILNMIVQGHQLGISGKAADEQLNVAVTLPERHNLSRCESEQKCETYTDVCLTLRGSSRLLPQTKKPPSCQTNIQSHMNEVRVSLKEKNKDNYGYWCRKGTLISLGYTPDSKLTVMLSYVSIFLKNLI
ncbi:transmembrane protein 248-like [Centruroides sculpturatus]|uniref:transmembrane protein 248-like n=1 Tax=Centruroides sculpturatus TaxID=218467 RepID=UPI000C6CFA95|nr:transmembrane protein 248-like [Centruroides sculpturatus]